MALIGISLMKAEDVITAYDVFIVKYKGVFDTCFPFKNVKGKEFTKITKPLISRGLLKSITTKK